MMALLQGFVRILVPAQLRASLGAKWSRARMKAAERPFKGFVNFGSLGRTRPIASYFGYYRGRPVDRYYIEQFLAECAGDVRGRVLEIGTDEYTRRYGGRGSLAATCSMWKRDIQGRRSLLTSHGPIISQATFLTALSLLRRYMRFTMFVQSSEQFSGF